MGVLIDALIDAFGPRSSMDVPARNALFQERLESLGPVSYERIEIAPFSIDRFGTTFGLIPDVPEDDDEDGLSLCLMPGNFMAFSEPWDSGDYDT